MLQRFSLVAATILACGSNCALSEPFSARPAPTVAAGAPMTFYVVKGAPDSCGRGCDRWIAVEGQVDPGAPGRFRRFLSAQHERNLLIYFSSPGGSLDHALSMGNMLREKPTIARVGRTVASECGFEAQDGEACIRLKQSGRELHGELITRGAICASACPYLILGAATREIAPDASLAVHSPKVVVRFRYGHPTQSAVEAATERGEERADHLLESYLARMGADVGLLDLADTVKFEELHLLTREELVRFGIDRREFVETPWTFESKARSFVHKVAAQRKPGETLFRTLQWQLNCTDSDHFAMYFQRPAPASPSFGTVSIVIDAKPLNFAFPPARPPGFEVWGMRMAKAQIQSLSDRPQLEFTETSIASDGRRVSQTSTLSSEGLAASLDRLLAACPPAKSPLLPQTTASGDRTEK